MTTDQLTDEDRREEHWREAERAARSHLLAQAIKFIQGNTDNEVVLLNFQADYGTPALLRVLATALEQEQGK